MKSNWKFLSEKTVFKDNIINVRHIDCEYLPVADKMTYTVVDISSWVLIIPIAKNGDFYVVKQFRIGNENDTLEFAGGAINKDEDPIIAAARELSEETGLTSDDISLLGVIEPNPAFMTNKCYIYLAKDAQITQEPERDKFEDTEVVRISAEHLKSMVKSGEFSQSISLAGYALFLNNQ